MPLKGLQPISAWDQQVAMNEYDPYKDFIDNPYGDGTDYFDISESGYNPTQFNMLANPDFAQYVSNQGLDLNKIQGVDLDNLISKYNSSSSGSMMDNFNSTLKGFLPSAQLGLGILSGIDNHSLYKKQKKLLNQQIANNAYEMDRRKKGSAHLKNIFADAYKKAGLGNV
jgi:hypothetical protein